MANTEVLTALITNAAAILIAVGTCATALAGARLMIQQARIARRHDDKLDRIIGQTNADNPDHSV